MIEFKDLQKVRDKAIESKYFVAPLGPISIKLHSEQNPREVQLEAYVELGQFTRSQCGFDLTVAGGGHGCFTVVMNVVPIEGNSTRISSLIRNPIFYRLLNHAKVDRVDFTVKNRTISKAAHRSEQIVFVTNRKRTNSVRSFRVGDANELFTDENDGALTYWIGDCFIPASSVDYNGGLMKRVWRHFKSIVSSFKPILGGLDNDHVQYSPFKKLSKKKFDEIASKEWGDARPLICVHGVKTSPSKAIESWVPTYRRISAVSQPMICFSWPALRSHSRLTLKKSYYRDKQEAGKVPSFIIQLSKNLVASTKSPINLLAHSAGGQIAVDSMVLLQAAVGRKKRHFAEVILVNPDICYEAVAAVVKVCLQGVAGRLTAITSTNDVAIGLSRVAWSAKRDKPDMLAGIADVVDCTKYAKDIMAHSPHFASSTVHDEIKRILNGTRIDEAQQIPTKEKQHNSEVYVLV